MQVPILPVEPGVRMEAPLSSGDNGLWRVMCYYTAKEDQSGEKPDVCRFIEAPTYIHTYYKLRPSPPPYMVPGVCMYVWTVSEVPIGIGLKVTRRVNKNRQTCKLAY